MPTAARWARRGPWSTTYKSCATRPALQGLPAAVRMVCIDIPTKRGCHDDTTLDAVLYVVLSAVRNPAGCAGVSGAGRRTGDAAGLQDRQRAAGGWRHHLGAQRRQRA